MIVEQFHLNLQQKCSEKLTVAVNHRCTFLFETVCISSISFIWKTFSKIVSEVGMLVNHKSFMILKDYDCFWQYK